MRTSFVLRFCFIAFMVAAVGACGRRGHTTTVADVSSAFPPRTVLFETPLAVDQVRAALVRALADRGYASEGESVGGVVASITSRNVMLRVSISYSETQAVIAYADSAGIEIDAAGRARTYDRWVANLESSIRSNLAPQPAPTPAPVAVVTPASPTPPPSVAIFARAQNAERVRPLLQAAFTSHSWVIEEDLTTAFVIRLDHGGEQVRLRCDFTQAQATLNYVSSQGLDFNNEGRNDEFERWVRNLVTAIQNSTR